MCALHCFITRARSEQGSPVRACSRALLDLHCLWMGLPCVHVQHRAVCNSTCTFWINLWVEESCPPMLWHPPVPARASSRKEGGGHNTVALQGSQSTWIGLHPLSKCRENINSSAHEFTGPEGFPQPMKRSCGSPAFFMWSLFFVLQKLFSWPSVVSQEELL